MVGLLFERMFLQELPNHLGVAGSILPTGVAILELPLVRSSFRLMMYVTAYAAERISCTSGRCHVATDGRLTRFVPNLPRLIQLKAPPLDMRL